MFPGTSPVLINDQGQPTNTTPPGNDRRWVFAQHPAIDQPQVADEFTEQGNPWLELWRIRRP